jgi:hypothetical protein
MDVDRQNVFARIDRDGLIKVAPDLGNIDSPAGREGPVADYVQDGLRREGFEARKVGLYPDRPNVLATLPGSGGGRSLCFNSHMDIAGHVARHQLLQRDAPSLSHLWSRSKFGRRQIRHEDREHGSMQQALCPDGDRTLQPRAPTDTFVEASVDRDANVNLKT